MRSAAEWNHEDWGLVLIALTAHANVLDAVPTGARHRVAELVRELAATARHEWATRSPLAPATTEPVDCSTCHGEGHVDAGRDYDLGMSTKPCPACSGEGVTEAP